MAVYCQLPDQAIELDAAVGGLILVRDRHIVVDLAASIPGTGVASDTVHNADRSSQKDPATLRAIQSGLHCFTGRPGQDETNIRRRIIDDMAPGEDNMVEFGVALHALGDSYAHRKNTDYMCRVPYGHAFEGGEERDVVGPDNAERFRAYCSNLYDALKGAAEKRQLKPRARPGEGILKSGLDTLTRATRSKSEQIVYLRNTATQIGQSMRPFRPNQDALEPILMLNIDGVAIGAYAYDAALACARKWAFEAAPPRVRQRRVS